MQHLNNTSALVALYIMENRQDIELPTVEHLIRFSTWAAVREEDEFFEPDETVNGDQRQETALVTQSEPTPPRPQRQPAAPVAPFAATTNHSKAEITNSITNDYIVSFEDGKHYKSMRTHLGRLGLTPEQYRAKHGLPDDYPMVAPGFSAARSSIARKSGFGTQRR